MQEATPKPKPIIKRHGKKWEKEPEGPAPARVTIDGITNRGFRVLGWRVFWIVLAAGIVLRMLDGCVHLIQTEGF